MDPAALAGLCLLLARGQTAQPLPAGVNCPPPSAPAAAAPGSSADGGLARRVAGQEAREAITRVAFAEAGNQGDSGLAAIVYTILNRLQDGRWGASVEAVVNARGQFEPVMRAGGDWRRLPAATVAQRARIDTILNLALEGRLPDLTNGARFFQNPQIVADRARRGEVSEGLVNFGGTGPSAVIGAHSFYVDVRFAGGQGRRPPGAASAPRGPSPDAAWAAAGGPIFVGENRAVRVIGAASEGGPEAAGEGTIRATKATDAGRSIFVAGPGLVAGSDQ